MSFETCSVLASYLTNFAPLKKRVLSAILWLIAFISMAINNPTPGPPNTELYKRSRKCSSGETRVSLRDKMLINRIEGGFKGGFLGLLTSMVSSGCVGSDFKQSKNSILVQRREHQTGSQDTWYLTAPLPQQTQLG